jgi:hypothetical protein
VTRLARLALLALLLPACGSDGGILELDLGLPARPPAPSVTAFAFIQARTAPAAPFGIEWDGDDPDGTALASTPERLAVSVVAEPDHVEVPVHVRVRYCRDPRCARFEDTGATEVQLTIERAFYSGERTFLMLDLPPAVPVELHEIAITKCRIRGCVGGTTTTFCRSDGTHFCE